MLKQGQTANGDADILYSGDADYDAYGNNDSGNNNNIDSNPYAGMERLRSARYQGRPVGADLNDADGQSRPSAIVDWADRQYQSQIHQDVHNPFAGDTKLKQPRPVRVAASDVNYTASGDALSRPSAVVNMLDEYRTSRSTVAVALAEGFDVNPMMMSERADQQSSERDQV
jgi:hypothetical protein